MWCSAAADYFIVRLYCLASEPDACVWVGEEERDMYRVEAVACKKQVWYSLADQSDLLPSRLVASLEDVCTGLSLLVVSDVTVTCSLGLYHIP